MIVITRRPTEDDPIRPRALAQGGERIALVLRRWAFCMTANADPDARGPPRVLRSRRVESSSIPRSLAARRGLSRRYRAQLRTRTGRDARDGRGGCGLFCARTRRNVTRPTRKAGSTPAEITDGLCGAHRPGHFRGVTTVVAKLFNLVNASGSFRRKRFPAAARDSKDGTRSELRRGNSAVPIVREKDGLAMSSRNAYCRQRSEKTPLALSLAIRAARDKHRTDPCCAEEIVFAATRVLKRMKGHRESNIVEAVDAETLLRATHRWIVQF